MRVPRSDRMRWLLASAIAGLALAVVLALFRRPTAAVVAPDPLKPATVTVAPESDPLLTEEAMLRDPTPLFLPTRWNVAENVLAAGARPEPGTSFQGYPPALKFAETELRLALPPAVAVPAGPLEAVAADSPARGLTGFGETDRTPVALPERGAYVEVSSAADGQIVLARALNDVQPPREAVWQPLQFLVAVDPAGMVQPAVLTESSQVAAVDDYFERYLSQQLHLGQRLAPGFYKVSIGP